MSTSNLHFDLIPCLSQSHIIPMINIARLSHCCSQHHCLSHHHSRKPLENQINCRLITESNLSIRFVSLMFPVAEFGLPKGRKNMDSIHSKPLLNFFDASKSLKRPVTKYLRNPNTLPVSRIVSNFIHGWTIEFAEQFCIPRVVFHGFSCFTITLLELLICHETYKTVSSDIEPMALPGLMHRT